MKNKNTGNETHINKKAQQKIEYIHHANALFHFMTKHAFLEKALEDSVIYPRYFIEDLEYLGLEGTNQEKFANAAVLGICFCDIPLSQICAKESAEYLDRETKSPEERNYSHTDLYGEYAIGFTKDWGEKHSIRPIQYRSTLKQSEQALTKGFNKLFREDDPPEEVVNLILESIAYCKPIRGNMYRTNQNGTSGFFTYRISKNFYNEQEWRFIPNEEICELVSKKVGSEIKPINAATGILLNQEGEQRGFFNRLSDEIAESKEKKIGIGFDHSDIAYLIVPNDQERRHLIESLIRIYHKRKMKNKMYDLISRIHTLEEIARDY